MIFKCCESLLHHLVINPKDIYFCCSTFDKRLEYLPEYDGSLLDLEYYKRIRKKYIADCKKGNYPEPCTQCPFFIEKDWDETLGFTTISVSNRTKCSCNCIYCIISGGGNIESKRILNTQETYDVKPVLEQLRRNNMVMPNCQFVIGGGECSEYPEGELEYLVYFSMMTDAYIILLSSGFYYSKAIENAIASSKAQLKISVDAGSREVYKQVKQADMFDKVWQNIDSYIASQKNNPHSEVILKYVIIPGVNDTVEEAKLFVERCLQAGCEKIEIALEFFWLEKNHENQNIPQTLIDTIRYFESQKDKNVFFANNISSHITKWLNENFV